ncbi:hypothetical protein [Streptomyces sclerotialus]|uniref:hypothetical protein n=1 Tax=Streptomyces sclerotialus TaxID=1957 RepID=UPI0004C4ABCE
MPTIPDTPDFADEEFDAVPVFGGAAGFQEEAGFQEAPDFGAVARDRAQQHEVIQEAVRRGKVAPDIAGALTDPQTGDWLLFHGFEVVPDLAALRGPDAGPVDVPAHLTDRKLPARINVSEPWYCTLLYRKLLLKARPPTRHGCSAGTGCGSCGRAAGPGLDPARMGDLFPRTSQRRPGPGPALQKKPKIAVARAVLSACGDEGYGVAGEQIDAAPPDRTATSAWPTGLPGPCCGCRQPTRRRPLSNGRRSTP